MHTTLVPTWQILDLGDAMALFSQDLFEVFEEKSEPVSLTGKKRRRADAQEGEKKREADQKKSRVHDLGEGTSSDQPMVIGEDGEEGKLLQQPSKELAVVEEGKSKEEAL